MASRLHLVAAAAVGSVLLLAGCATKASVADSARSPGRTPAGTGAAATLGPALPPAPVPKKPVVKVPKGPPPGKLVIKDLTVGTGTEATAGHTVVVQYVGVSWSTGKEFDASWDRGQPLDFVLGQGGVIQGWDQGVAGMRVGGRRKLIIPPTLGYGAKGYPPSIKPNETLVFVIDLLSVH